VKNLQASERIVADEQVIHAAPRACITYQAAAQDLRLARCKPGSAQSRESSRTDAVLITERQVTEKVLERADARFASSSARRGPTPLRYITSVVGVSAFVIFISPHRCRAATCNRLRMRKDGALLL